jgi:replication factor C small subunit
MKKVDDSQFIWAEKYRPRTLDDLIITEDYRRKFQDFIDKDRFPHLLLTSVMPGVGKTSSVHSLINDLGADVLWINGSQDRGIDTIKSKTKDFITSVSIDDSPKIVVIDESDGLTPEAQRILRGVIEEFSKHSTFIMTANYKEKLIEPLRNRFIHFDFDNIYSNNKKELGTQIFKRLQFVLDNENTTYENKDLQQIVTNMYPSVRKMVLTLQQSVQDNHLVINESIVNLNNKFTDILQFIKDKNFIELRKLLQTLDDPGSFYTFVYKNLDEWFKPNSQPHVVLLCAKYQDMHERARDKAINTAAFCVEIMGTTSIEFK